MLSELSRQLTWSHELADLSHYRDRDRFEVGAVLESRSGRVVGIEVKAASTVGPDGFRGLRRLAERLGDDFVAGIVLCTGPSTLPFGDKLRHAGQRVVAGAGPSTRLRPSLRAAGWGGRR